MQNYCRLEMAGIVRYAPDIKQVGKSLSVCNFLLVVSFGKGNKKRSTSFRCVAWNELAKEIHSKVSINDNIVIKGSIENKRYKEQIDEENEAWRDWWQVTVYECALNGTWLQSDEKPVMSAPQPQVVADEPDDLPF